MRQLMMSALFCCAFAAAPSLAAKKPVSHKPAPAQPAAAKPAPVKRVVRLSPKNTKLNFQAYSRLVDADGRFGTFSGTVAMTDNDPSSAALKVTVKIASLNTGIDKRDDHLRNPDFFNVKKWPQAVFTSSAVKKVAKDKFQVKGHLTMMGKKVPVSFPADIWIAKDGKLRAKADFKMDRRKWGMTGYMSSWGVNPIKASVRIHFEVKE